MKRLNTKKAVLAAVLVLLTVVLSGCYTEPEAITGGANSGYSGPGVYPMLTATPSPVPTSTPYNQGSDGTGPIVVLPSTEPQTTSTSGPIISLPSMSVTTPMPSTPSPTPTVSTVLKLGAKGQEVRNLQSKLKTLGYYKGSVDGDFGEGTKDAVVAFQKANGLNADGVAGEKTLQKLATSKVTAKPTATPTPKVTATPKISENIYLKLGNNNSNVKKMQERLIDLGYLNGTATGKFCVVTEVAVIAFQNRNISYSDGIAGYQTLTKLYSSSARKAGSSAGIIGISLKNGSSSSAAVKTMQRKLKSLGYYTGSIDGSFGSTTETAVKAFQKNNGLKADGNAGASTFNVLFGGTAKKASESSDGGATATPKVTNPPSYRTVTEPPAGSDYITLRVGDSGSPVKELQTELRKLGYYSGSVDGRYGASTSTAVTAFQKAKGLRQDGVAGPATQRVLFEGDYPVGS